MNRRHFITDAAFTGAGLLLLNHVSACASQMNTSTDSDEMAQKSFKLLKEIRRYKKIDAHSHVNLYHGAPERNIHYADQLGINKMVISRPITSGAGTPNEFIAYNNLVLDAMKQFPNRFIGSCTINPQYQRQSMEEIKRCMGEGMIGLKLYTQVKINDPLLFPVIEQFINLNMVVHMHSECQLGVAGYRMKYDKKIKPNGSLPEDFAEAARRYPEAIFQFAHIGGGGDWEYECKLLKHSPNVYLDISGSNNEAGMIDFAVREVGAQRLLYGSDGSYYQTIGNMMASGLTKQQREDIFFNNYNNLLRRSGNHVN